MTPANVPTEARFGRVVTPAMDEEAERRVSKSELKVEVYTPLVTVPALPEILIPWVFVQVLVSARSVEDAAVPASAARVVPSYVRPEPMRSVPTCDVPFPFKMPVSVVEPVPPEETPSAVRNVGEVVKVFESARSVEDAARIVEVAKE